LSNQINKYNENLDASLLIKGESPIYIASLCDSANKKLAYLEFDKKREYNSFDSIPLVINAGLSAVFNSVNLDELYITIKKELCYSGDYYVDEPAEIIEHKEPQDIPIFKLLDELCLYIDNYSNTDDKFENVVNHLGAGFSFNLDMSLYLQAILKEYDMDLISIVGSVDKKELYIKLTNRDYEMIRELFKVSNENDFSNFNIILYKERFK